jgi:hypothetical protein
VWHGLILFFVLILGRFCWLHELTICDACVFMSMSTGPQVAARHILMDDLDGLKSAHSKISAKKGTEAVLAEFVSQAKANSKCPSGKEGGRWRLVTCHPPVSQFGIASFGGQCLRSV